MIIQEIAESWGIVFPKRNDDYLFLPEYLLQEYPSKCYFADFFPKQISESDANKHTQIESVIYDLIYSRMYRVILKLWMYDNLYFESELLSDRTPCKKYLRKKLLKKMTTNCIEKEEDLRTLMLLSKKNIIDIVLAFEKNHILVIPSWSCFFMFVEDERTLPLIKDILSTEGLFLRNSS